jgi:predicted CXXCH cytochrome family protein
MNRIVIASIALVMFVGAVAKAQTTGIVGSKHDFSTAANASWSGGEICKPCHTPHAAPNPSSISKAMWNHTLSSATYTTASGTMSAVSGLDNTSRLCLGCHDGTVALDSFGGATGSVIIGTTTGGDPKTNLGLGANGSGTADLSNDHPVGYTAVVKSEDTGHGVSFNPVSTSGKIGLGTTQLSLVTDGTTRTVNGAAVTNYSVGCCTCHGHHPTAIPKLLRIDNTASALCLTCHIK